MLLTNVRICGNSFLSVIVCLPNRSINSDERELRKKSQGGDSTKAIAVHIYNCAVYCYKLLSVTFEDEK